jgi:hypothetical protein
MIYVRFDGRLHRIPKDRGQGLAAIVYQVRFSEVRVKVWEAVMLLNLAFLGQVVALARLGLRYWIQDQELKIEVGS